MKHSNSWFSQLPSAPNGMGAIDIVGIKQIQRDAIKQGKLEAARIAIEIEADSSENPISKNEISDAILEDRDNTPLP